LRTRLSRTQTLCAALILGAALLLGLSQTATGEDFLESLGLRADQRGYTELSFSRPDDLPKRFTGTADFTAPFVIRNAQAAERTYRWTVEQRVGGGGRLLASGETPVVPRGRALYVNPRLKAACVGAGRAQTVVRLDGLPQRVAFWASCAKAGSS
jgi:hypothetical protein